MVRIKWNGPRSSLGFNGPVWCWSVFSLWGNRAKHNTFCLYLPHWLLNNYEVGIFFNRSLLHSLGIFWDWSSQANVNKSYISGMWMTWRSRPALGSVLGKVNFRENLRNFAICVTLKIDYFEWFSYQQMPRWGQFASIRGRPSLAGILERIKSTNRKGKIWLPDSELGMSLY